MSTVTQSDTQSRSLLGDLPRLNVRGTGSGNLLATAPLGTPPIQVRKQHQQAARSRAATEGNKLPPIDGMKARIAAKGGLPPFPSEQMRKAKVKPVETTQVKPVETTQVKPPAHNGGAVPPVEIAATTATTQGGAKTKRKASFSGGSGSGLLCCLGVGF